MNIRRGGNADGEMARRRPIFSVVIPTWNRSRNLRSVLEAYEAQQSSSPDFELVVVDDGSSDETPALLASYLPTRFVFRSVCQPNRGPATARNRGLELARGEYVLFSGDDIEPAPDLLARHFREHKRVADSRFAVLGRIDWAQGLRLTSTMRHVDGVGAQQFSYSHMKSGDEYDFRHFYTSNVSVARSLLECEPEGFSTDFSAAAFEDAEYSYRLCRHGMKIVYHEDAQAWHHHQYNAQSFFDRQVVCGKMAAVLVRKWPRTGALVGLDEVRKRRRQDAFSWPGRRGRVARIETRLEEYEALAIKVATIFDEPVTPAVDPLLLRLFRYGFLKGLSGATYPADVARRMASSWFADLMSEGAAQLRSKLDADGLALVDRQLDELAGRLA